MTDDGVAMAIAAHPDDIEFLMAGTLLMLARSGHAIHYMTIANGSCGSTQQDATTTVATRRGESVDAADVLGATYHESVTDDLMIFHDDTTIRRVAAVIREVQPSILLVPSFDDYMEDHQNAGRVAVTAAFARGMPNYRTEPARPASSRDVTVYHAMPHGLRDAMRRRITPGSYVDTTSVHAIKKEALACHRSQLDWLETSQGPGAYLEAMEDMSIAIGRSSGRFEHAEGWRRHSHLGFSAIDADPLSAILGSAYLVDEAYERGLEKGGR